VHSEIIRLLESFAVPVTQVLQHLIGLLALQLTHMHDSRNVQPSGSNSIELIELIKHFEKQSSLRQKCVKQLQEESEQIVFLFCNLLTLGKCSVIWLQRQTVAYPNCKLVIVVILTDYFQT